MVLNLSTLTLSLSVPAAVRFSSCFECRLVLSVWCLLGRQLFWHVVIWLGSVLLILVRLVCVRAVTALVFCWEWMKARACMFVSMRLVSRLVVLVTVDCGLLVCLGGRYNMVARVVWGVALLMTVAMGVLIRCLVSVVGLVTAVDVRSMIGLWLHWVVIWCSCWTMPFMRELKMFWHRRVLLMMTQCSLCSKCAYEGRCGRSEWRTRLGPARTQCVRVWIYWCLLMGALLLQAVV